MVVFVTLLTVQNICWFILTLIPCVLPWKNPQLPSESQSGWYLGAHGAHHPSAIHRAGGGNRAKPVSFTPQLDKAAPASLSQMRGRKKERREKEQSAIAYYTASTSTRDSDRLFPKKDKAHSKHLMQRIMLIPTGLQTQRAHSRPDTQLSVQRHFHSKAVHSDLLGSFIDWYFLTFY